MTPSTFEERVNHRAVHYLSLQVSQTFLDANCGAGEEERFTLSHVKNILQKFKTSGIYQAKYKKSTLDKTSMFRSYGDGIQGMPTSFRGLLCNGLMTDIDMVNAYPSILLNICKQRDIPCHYLTQYCENRKQLLEKGTFTKIDILKCINKKSKVKGDVWLMAFDAEIKTIQSNLIIHFQEIYGAIEDKTKNTIGTFMTRVCMYYENLFLNAIVDFIHKRYPVAVLMFDGLMVYGSPPITILDELSELVKTKFNFNIKFAIKEHDTSIIIPDDFVMTDDVMTYEMMKQKYETEYELSYIVKNCSYSYKVGNTVCFFNLSQLTQTLYPIKIGKAHFFALWCDDPSRQTFNDVGVFPHDVKADDAVMNLWKGFSVEKKAYPIVDIEPILKHLRILVGHEEASYVFMLKWLANLFQYPSSTSIFVNLASKEGAGKSLFVDMIGSMVGKDKSAEITNMSDELFGVFNSQLRDVVLMNINEVEKIDASKCFERLKSQITSPTIMVHGKGEKPYPIANLRKFISTNNNPHAITIKEGNRRYFATESSNELIGNTEYFKTFIEFINQADVQYSFWKFLMEYETPRQLTSRDIPITKLMLEAFKLNRDPVEDFAEELANDKKLFSDELYTHYKQFMGASGLEYSLNAKQFAMKIKRALDKRIVSEGRTDVIEDGVRICRRFIILKE